MGSWDLSPRAPSCLGQQLSKSAQRLFLKEFCCISKKIPFPCKASSLINTQGFPSDAPGLSAKDLRTDLPLTWQAACVGVGAYTFIKATLLGGRARGGGLWKPGEDRERWEH